MMKKTKTVLIVTSYAPSLVNFRRQLILDLMAKGVRVATLAPGYDRNTYETLCNMGVLMHKSYIGRAGVNPFRELYAIIDCYLNIIKIKPDIILSYFVKPVIYCGWAAKLAFVPRRFSMIEGLGYFFTYQSKEMKVLTRFLRWLIILMYRSSLRYSSRVIFVNPDDENEFLSNGLIKAEQAACIYGIGVDLNEWQYEPTPSGEIQFLLVARLLREKGVYEYAEAAKIVKLKYPQVQFVLLGGIDENPGAIQLEQVSAWNDQGVLTWHGHVPVAKYMKNASVYVLPSYREGVPVSTMEAMAMGRPIITTDVPGCRETVVDGVNGFMVPAQDAVKLAERMIWFIENPLSIATMGAASRKIAEEKFDVHKVNTQLMKIMFGD